MSLFEATTKIHKFKNVLPEVTLLSRYIGLITEMWWGGVVLYCAAGT
jgi:hypothetical protein